MPAWRNVQALVRLTPAPGFFLGGLVSPCACPRPLSLAGLQVVRVFTLLHVTTKTKQTKKTKQAKRLQHPMCRRWPWFSSLCSWGLCIRCLRQSCAHIQSYHDDNGSGAGQERRFVFGFFLFSWNKSWMTTTRTGSGSFFVAVPGGCLRSAV